MILEFTKKRHKTDRICVENRKHTVDNSLFNMQIEKKVVLQFKEKKENWIAD